jgi:hypothetical protein
MKWIYSDLALWIHLYFQRDSPARSDELRGCPFSRALLRANGRLILPDESESRRASPQNFPRSERDFCASHSCDAQRLFLSSQSGGQKKKTFPARRSFGSGQIFFLSPLQLR